MTAGPFAVLGLARARSLWFPAVAQWVHSGVLPAEFVKCISVEEVRARLASGRPFSALLVDAGLTGVDRDVVAAATAVGAATLVVDDPRVPRDWLSLGVAAVLPSGFGREDLLDALCLHAPPAPRSDAIPAPEPDAPLPATGRLIAVTGPGGTGASTTAIAIAQHLASAALGHVLLADFCLNAEQAMLHDARDVVPGVQELVDAHRAGCPDNAAVRALTFAVGPRGYDLLLGLRRARFWSAIRPGSFAAAVDSLRRAYPFVVCDIDADLEGEDGGGSLDVEERNVMARATVNRADVVAVVGAASMKGVHSLTRVVLELASAGVALDRVLPVVVAGRTHRRATENAVRELVGAVARDVPADAVFVHDRHVDEALRDGARLPTTLTGRVGGAVSRLLHATEPRPDPISAPVRVRPGTVGQWAAAEP